MSYSKRLPGSDDGEDCNNNRRLPGKSSSCNSGSQTPPNYYTKEQIDLLLSQLNVSSGGVATDNFIEVIEISLTDLDPQYSTVEEQIAMYFNTSQTLEYSPLWSKINILLYDGPDKFRLFELVEKNSGVYGLNGVNLTVDDILQINDYNVFEDAPVDNKQYIRINEEWKRDDQHSKIFNRFQGVERFVNDFNEDIEDREFYRTKFRLNNMDYSEFNLTELQMTIIQQFHDFININQLDFRIREIFNSKLGPTILVLDTIIILLDEKGRFLLDPINKHPSALYHPQLFGGYSYIEDEEHIFFRSYEGWSVWQRYVWDANGVRGLFNTGKYSLLKFDRFGIMDMNFSAPFVGFDATFSISLVGDDHLLLTKNTTNYTGQTPNGRYFFIINRSDGLFAYGNNGADGNPNYNYFDDASGTLVTMSMQENVNASYRIFSETLDKDRVVVAINRFTNLLESNRAVVVLKFNHQNLTFEIDPDFVPITFTGYTTGGRITQLHAVEDGFIIRFNQSITINGEFHDGFQNRGWNAKFDFNGNLIPNFGTGDKYYKNFTQGTAISIPHHKGGFIFQSSSQFVITDKDLNIIEKEYDHLLVNSFQILTATYDTVTNGLAFLNYRISQKLDQAFVFAVNQGRTLKVNDFNRPGDPDLNSVEILNLIDRGRLFGVVFLKYGIYNGALSPKQVLHEDSFEKNNFINLNKAKNLAYLNVSSNEKVIKFDKSYIYGSIEKPLTLNLIEDNRNLERTHQTIFYQGDTFTPPATWFPNSGSETYDSSVVNVITVTVFSETYKRYSITSSTNANGGGSSVITAGFGLSLDTNGNIQLGNLNTVDTIKISLTDKVNTEGTAILQTENIIGDNLSNYSDFTLLGQNIPNRFWESYREISASAWNSQTKEFNKSASLTIQAQTAVNNGALSLANIGAGGVSLEFYSYRNGDTNVDDTYARFRDFTNERGVEYSGDYEANFVPRSLVTKQYTDALINSVARNDTTFTTSLRFDKDYKSKTTQITALNFTLDNTDYNPNIHYFNKYQIEIVSDGVNGVPTFDVNQFEIQFDSWSNVAGAVNILTFQAKSTGKIPVWIRSIT